MLLLRNDQGGKNVFYGQSLAYYLEQGFPTKGTCTAKGTFAYPKRLF